MNIEGNNKTLILCAGLQCSGTTMISWCFLQRSDMDGVYDMENSVIQTDFNKVITPYIWVKMTIGSFRFNDIKAVYEDLGYEVIPLLVVRDVRNIFSSLIKKEYGINGVVAEEPPIRMRFRRFYEDWKLFYDNKWPVLKYETFIKEPKIELKRVLSDMNLDWDDSMIQWGKSIQDISYMSVGNRSFRESMESSHNLYECLDASGTDKVPDMPESELDWLEQYFMEFNIKNDYVVNLEKSGQIKLTESKLVFESGTRMKLNQKLEDMNNKAKEMYAKYRDCNLKLQRIKNHLLFGNLLKIWKLLINRSFEV